ncbi:MAG: hypothetical protein J6N76_05040, partial [Lachnospiraceae bacterium]|nr:hypothetical protein [Lachnospiraceae bacterium]
SMKKYLKEYQVADFKDYANRGLISEQEYIKILNSVDDYHEYKKLDLLTPEEFAEGLQRTIANTIKNNNKRPENKDKEKISRNRFFHIKEAAEKKKPPILVEEDFSYADMFKNSGVMESEEVKKAIPDEKLRKFLADNIGALLIGNPALITKFPFMKGIKGLDQLDNLTYGQFELVMNELKGNIVNAENQENLKSVLSEENEKKKNYMLLGMVRLGLDKDGLTDLSKSYDERKKRKALLQRQRTLLNIGGKYVPRDGKIRFRFEDMPDREKSILNSWFGKGKGWLAQRQRKFENANRVWTELEKIGPEAVDQVREWCKQIYRDTGGDYEQIKKELANLSRLMTTKAIKDVKTGMYRVSGKGLYFEIDSNLEKSFIERSRKEGGINSEHAIGEFLQLIQNAFTKVGEKVPVEFDEEDVKKNKKVDAEQKKLMQVNSFMLEMTMCNLQDVIFGHGGKGMEDFFTYNGQTNDEEYNKKLIKWAMDAQNRIELMDEHLKPYKSNPKLYKEMSDKLIHRYMNIDIKADQKVTAHIDDYNRRSAILSEKIEQNEILYKNTAEIFTNFNKEHKIAIQVETSGILDDPKAFVEYAENAMKDPEVLRFESAEVLKTMQTFVEQLNKYYSEIEADKKERRRISDNKWKLQRSLYKKDSMESLEEAVKDNIFEDGTYSDEVCDVVELYESRKRLLSGYKNGELASLWDAFEKDDDTFMALMDPIESVAQKKIEELYDKLAPLGQAVSLQYDYVGRFFLEENMAKILDGSSKLLEGLKGRSDIKSQTSYWTSELVNFQNKYLSQKKQNTKSINENLKEARSGLVNDLAKYLYYNDSSVDMDMKNQTKKFRKWWFFESHNYGVDRVVQEKDENRYMVSVNHADDIVRNMVEAYLHNSTDLLQHATNLGDLKKYYQEIMLPRIIENDKAAERAFLRYVMEEEYHKKPLEQKPDMFNPHPGLTDGEIMEAMAQLSAEEMKSIEERIVRFKDYIRNQMINLSE